MVNNFVEVINSVDSERDFLGNLLEQVRLDFGLYENYLDHKQFMINQQKYEEFIKKCFNEIKNRSDKFYRFFIALLYHDQCIMLNTSEEDENKKVLNELQDKVKNIDDLIKLINNDYTYLMDMIIFFLDFNELNYYERRMKFKMCNNIDNYLNKIFKLHFIDALFYTKKIELGDLINMYNEADFFRRFDKKFNPVIYSLKNIKNLSLTDEKNSEELIISLLNRTYKYLLFEYDIKRINDVTSYKLNNLIKNGDLKDLSHVIVDNDKYLKLVLEYFFDETFNYEDSYIRQVEQYYNLKENEKVKRKLMVNDNGSNWYSR